jgi:hypothetical protein
VDSQLFGFIATAYGVPNQKENEGLYFLWDNSSLIWKSVNMM